ncbi:hypothetical protein Cgig2_029918 [Carnegiea gigantea]|uniref:Retrotransposon Copia-like N-terminal domain-containing protein n=1 Tax=Carnegiea gigantea TaxID=171969 RepID=A0A9Q1KIT2_9CARY|nr:hypothetical protein Cgig2_029918 [Carnegiea gigantea]
MYVMKAELKVGRRIAREPGFQKRCVQLDSLNPLFIHPLHGPHPFNIGEKLLGSTNYRSWKRAMEMYLSTKHKLVFVFGTFPKPQDDHLKAAQWEACNNLEELQSEALEDAKYAQVEASALYNKTGEDRCVAIKDTKSISNVSYFCAKTVKNDWILDTGAIDLMTPHLSFLQRIRSA